MKPLPQTGGSYRRDNEGGLTPVTEEASGPAEQNEATDRTATAKTRKS
jgi:hypothetical protein